MQTQTYEYCGWNKAIIGFIRVVYFRNMRARFKYGNVFDIRQIQVVCFNYFQFKLRIMNIQF